MTAKNKKIPTRVQRRRKKGFRLPPNSVCITRETGWGNPFINEQAIEAFRLWLRNPQFTCQEVVDYVEQKHGPFTAGLANHKADADRTAAALLSQLPKLHGKKIACFCAIDRPCHGDELISLIAEQPSGTKKLTKGKK